MSKYYVVRYALSKGIMEVVGEIAASHPDMLRWIDPKQATANFAHGEGREWCRTKDDAVARAEVIRRLKILSLKQQIAKLERIDFGQ